MLGMIAAPEWLSGRWIPAGYAAPASAGDSLSDIFGQTLAVGTMVKLIGTITAINPMDPHFQDITITPQFPQSGLVSPEAGVFPQNIPVKSYQFHPLQLMKVGSSY